MNSFQKHIYEELIADDDFIRWASNKHGSKSGYWESWVAKHPDSKIEFDEALRTVRLLRFNAPGFSDTELDYLWKKTNRSFDKSKSKNWIRQFVSLGTKFAAVLFIPLFLSVLWLYQKNNIIRTEHEQLKPITLLAPLGGIVNFELPDGSKVWLNSGSEIKYLANFGNVSREVSLSGEAYFEVEKSDVPFLVSNIGPQVKVYGTRFNVNAYANEDEVIVALVEGKVSLNVNNDEVFIKPGEVSKFDKRKRKLLIQQTNMDQYISWREGEFIFRDATLISIIRTLERRYNTKISIADAEVANYRYNAIVKEQTFEQILELLSLTAPIKYEYIKSKQNNDSSFSQARAIISKDKNRSITR